MSRHFSPYFDFRAGDGIQEGKKTKGNINRRGYNKFLTMEGDVKVSMTHFDSYSARIRVADLKEVQSNIGLVTDGLPKRHTCLVRLSYLYRENRRNKQQNQNNETTGLWI